MKISVYITSFNQRDYLVEAIESVLARTLRPHQVIIIDGSSSDGSQEVIAGYASRYPDWITPLYHDRNYGIAQTRTDALRAVTGDYVTLVDGDDRFLPAKLEREAAALAANADADGVFSDFYFLNAAGERTYRWAERSRPPEGDVFLPTFGCDFPRRTLFRLELVNYRRLQEIGSFDSNLWIYEDWEMHIRLARHCCLVYVPEPLSEYRRSGRGLSSAPVEDHLAAIEYIIAKHRPLLEELSVSQRDYVLRNLNKWRAHILRHAALGTIGRKVPDYRRLALRYYGQSLAYHPVVDWRLLVRLVWPQAHRFWRHT